MAGDVDATPTIKEDVAVDDGVSMGHKSKQIKVGIRWRWQLEHGIDDHAKSTTEDPLGRIEVKRQPLTEAQMSKDVDDQNNQLLLQMAMLCESVKMLGAQMNDGFRN